MYLVTFLFLGILRRTISKKYEEMDLEDSFDLNSRNNKMTLFQACSMLESDLERDAISRLLSEADFDGDGCISWQEYPGFIRLVQNEYASKNAGSLI